MITKHEVALLPDLKPNLEPIKAYFRPSAFDVAGWEWRYAMLLGGERYDAYENANTHRWLYLDYDGCTPAGD